MTECIQCGKLTKYNVGLRKDCYSKAKVGTKEIEPATEIEGNGKVSNLTDKQRTFQYDMITGRIAETLIQELFVSKPWDLSRIETPVVNIPG